MTQMIYEVYEALKSIGIAENKATEVAKVLGNQDEKLNAVKFELKEEIREFRSEINARITKLESDLGARIRLNQWMLGIVIVMQGIVLGVIFRFLSP